MGPPSRAIRAPSWRGTVACAGANEEAPASRRALLDEGPSEHPGMRRREGWTHDHRVISESPQGVDFDRAGERRLASAERNGIFRREQDDPDLVRHEKVGETPAGAGPGDPGAGLGEVLFEQRLDCLRLRVARRVLARRSEHEVALAIDLPLAVGGVGEERPPRKKQRCAREGACEKGAPAGAPLRSDGALSCGTCRTHRGSARPSPRSSERPRPGPRAGPRRRCSGCTPARWSARARPAGSRSSGSARGGPRG